MSMQDQSFNYVDSQSGISAHDYIWVMTPLPEFRVTFKNFINCINIKPVIYRCYIALSYSLIVQRMWKQDV